MKLVHSDIAEKLTSDCVNILTVENARAFRELCGDLHDAMRGEGKFVLSDEDKTLNAAKVGMLIADPTEPDFADRKLIGKLYTELGEIAEEKFADELADIAARIAKLFDKINSESSVGAEWSGEFSAAGLLKIFGVEIKREYDGFVEKLIAYISAAVNLCGVRFVAFVNLKSYLTTDELRELYKFLRYNDILALSIESFALPKIDGEFSVIIDKDLCEIVA